MTSEFGKGLVYCLGLFLAHQFMWRNSREITGGCWAGLWFNGASDHAFELQIDSAPKHLRERLQQWRDKVVNWGHGFSRTTKATEKDVDWAIQEAKDILRAIDEYYGVPTEQGSCE